MPKNSAGRLLVFILTACLYTTVYAQDKDSVKVYWLDPVEVKSEKTQPGIIEIPLGKNKLENTLGQHGYSFIRKGGYLASDVYNEGFKKGDIKVTIDGERFFCACPNRMDSPILRVNTIELKTIELSNSTNINAGIGGGISFKRTSPAENFSIRGGVSTSQGALNEFDASVMGEAQNQRFTLRYANGRNYDDADGNTFTDLYGYAENKNYFLGEANYLGIINDVKIGFSVAHNEDVSFPYLQMDDRKNTVYSASVSYMDYKAYGNYTYHLMDNNLRTSSNNMIMESFGKNFTAGFTGNFFDIYYRKWDVDNFIQMSSGIMRIENKMIPEAVTFSALVSHSIEFDFMKVSGKAGMVRHSVGETGVEDFYNSVHGQSELSRIFPIAGITASRSFLFEENAALIALAEVSTDAPEVENLFRKVNRMMNKPDWSGNPNLHQPVRASLKTNFSYKFLSADLFATNVWNYVDMESKQGAAKMFMTYKNINAYMLGFNFNAAAAYFDFNMKYTYAENSTDNTPLSEIPPLSTGLTVKLPEYKGFNFYARHTYNDAQTRIDPELSEKSSSAWNKFDLGVSYNYENLKFSFEIENLSNEKYYRHLSYLRDPFSSGMQVYEPGRSFFISIKYNNSL